jgi:hypothetical protein
MRLSEQLQKITPKGSEFACLFNKNPRSKATKYFGTEIEVQVASEHMVSDFHKLYITTGKA